MNNFKLFSGNYVEVTLPLDERIITAFDNSEYAYLLEDFYRENSNPAYSSIGLTLTVAFDFKSMETFFSLNTICVNDYGVDSGGDINIDLDPVTAAYFKNEALKYLAENFTAMKACQIGRITVSA